jgi:hypothetical protein
LIEKEIIAGLSSHSQLTHAEMKSLYLALEKSASPVSSTPLDEPCLGLHWASWRLQMLVLSTESRQAVASPGPLLALVMMLTFTAMLLLLIVWTPDYQDTCPATAEKLDAGFRIIGYEVKETA